MALFLTTEWIAQGRPPRIRLVELGPGRGTLMDDILRVGLTSGRSAVLSKPRSQADHTDLPLSASIGAPDVRRYSGSFIPSTPAGIDLSDRDVVTPAGTARTTDQGSITFEREGRRQPGRTG